MRCHNAKPMLYQKTVLIPYLNSKVGSPTGKSIERKALSL
jgi:hypothetical protein